MKHIIRLLALTTMGSLIVGCGSSGSSYSLLSTGQSFKQAKVNSKIDMLWMVDNSPSMQPLQTNLTTNFNSFINQFETKGYDYHLAVTSSEAYLAGASFHNQPAYSKFSDGVGTHTGVFDIVPGTANLISTFVTNATLGANGSGDERAFASIKTALNDTTQNPGFVRPDSFLAVIILSDEDDFSDPTRAEYSWTFRGGIPDHDYADPGLETTASYVSYFDTLTNSTGAFRRYAVSAITVPDATCLNAYSRTSPGSIIGQRYMDIANATGGVIGSVCDVSYASALTAIQNRILELGTQFYLNAPPIVSSIVVTVNGAVVPSDPTNGWSYNPAANSVVFHGTAIPPAGADINVAFDPSKLTF